MNKGRLVGFSISWLIVTISYGQRLSDVNAIGWYTYNGDHKVGEKWALHSEYQWRRIDFIRAWQQSLARLGLVHMLSDRVNLSGGYTYLTTFPFGSYPQADLGVPYSEHRLYEDVQWKEVHKRLSLTHRVRLEQRWQAQQNEQNPRQVKSWEYQNRVRYQIAGELALKGSTIDDDEWYLNFFDELFISFGPNVGENIYNQNRLSGGLGYRIRENVKLELNYLNQILQHADPDPVSQRSVFEYNNGFRLNVNYDLDFTKKKPSAN